MSTIQLTLGRNLGTTEKKAPVEKIFPLYFTQRTRFILLLNIKPVTLMDIRLNLMGSILFEQHSGPPPPKGNHAHTSSGGSLSLLGSKTVVFMEQSAEWHVIQYCNSCTFNRLCDCSKVVSTRPRRIKPRKLSENYQVSRCSPRASRGSMVTSYINRHFIRYVSCLKKKYLYTQMAKPLRD